MHTAVTSRLVSVPAVVNAGIRAAARDQRAFDDLVEVGLGQGLVTRRVVTGLAAGLGAGLGAGLAGALQAALPR